MAEKLTVGAGWVICESGGKTYFGRVVAPPEPPEPPESSPVVQPRPEGATEPAPRDEARDEGPPSSDEDDEGSGFFLQPCYDVLRLVLNNPDGTMREVRLNLLPYGLCWACPPVLIANPDTVAEVGEMDELDRVMYRDLVRLAEQTKANMRASRSPIKLAAALEAPR